MFLRSMAMDDPNGCLPAQNPSHRRIARRRRDHHGVQRLVLGLHGADPAADLRRRRADAGVAADVRRRARVRTRRSWTCSMPGATEADTIRAGSPIGEAGYAIYDDLVHGYGVDIEPPIVDRSCVQWWPWDDANPAPAGRPFEEGMAVVVQPNPITPDERMGLQLGQLGVVRADGHGDAPRRAARAAGGGGVTPVGVALIGTGMWAGQLARRGRADARGRARHLLRPGRGPARGVRRRDGLRGGAVASRRRSRTPRVEAVLLATPNVTHAEQAAACAERGQARLRGEADRRHARGRRAPCAPPARAPGVALLVGHDLRRLGAARAVKRARRRGRARPGRRWPS